MAPQRSRRSAFVPSVRRAGSDDAARSLNDLAQYFTRETFIPAVSPPPVAKPSGGAIWLKRQLCRVTASEVMPCRQRRDF
jgi:hypothetical protein